MEKMLGRVACAIIFSAYVIAAIVGASNGELELALLCAVLAGLTVYLFKSSEDDYGYAKCFTKQQVRILDGVESARTEKPEAPRDCGTCRERVREVG